MFGKSKKPEIIGAKNKIAVARQMRDRAMAEMQAKGAEMKKQSQAVPVTVVYCLAVVFAMLVTDSGSNPFASLHPTGFSDIDRLLTGSGIPVIMGDRELDRLIVVLFRGFAFFLAGGFIPFLAFVVLRISDRARINPLVMCWGMLILVPMAYYLSDGLADTFNQLMSGF